MESADDSQFASNPDTDILRYMADNGATTWYGFQGGTGVNGANASQLELYMDWPGHVTGTTNNLNGTILGNVSQTSGGFDSFGNAIVAYTFETIEVPANTVTGDIWYSIWVPHSLLDNSSKVYSTIQVNFNGSPTSLTSLTTDSTLRSIDVVYTGTNWPNTTYRVFSNNGGYNQGSSGVLDTTENYFRGGSLI